MEASVEGEPGTGTGDDVMSRVGIAPSAIARWRTALDEFARTTPRSDLKDTSNYPCETVHELGDGSLLLLIEFNSGDEVSMKIAPSEWRWSPLTRVH